MTLGIIPGISLQYPHYNHLMVGSFRYGCTIFRMHPMRREKRLPVMMSATIEWTHGTSSPQTIEGVPYAVRTRHIIHPNGGTSDRNALVMLGVYKDTHHIVYLNERMAPFEKRGRKHNPVTEIGSGGYVIGWNRIVKQRLCIMKPKSFIGLISKDKMHSNSYVYWDGSSLAMLRWAMPIISLA